MPAGADAGGGGLGCHCRSVNGMSFHIRKQACKVVGWRMDEASKAEGQIPEGIREERREVVAVEVCCDGGGDDSNWSGRW